MKKIIFVLLVIVFTCPVLAQTAPAIRCKIWQPYDFCVMPDSVVYFRNVECISCNWDYYPCAGLTDQPDLKAVWLTMTGNWTNLTLGHDSGFVLTDHLKSISVTKKNTGKVIYPYAILLDGHPDYMKAKFTAKKYRATYDPKKRFDLFILFWGAEKGDKLKIEGFMEAEIL